MAYLLIFSGAWNDNNPNNYKGVYSPKDLVVVSIRKA
jgi:hypothetical protein